MKVTKFHCLSQTSNCISLSLGVFLDTLILITDYSLSLLLLQFDLLIIILISFPISFHLSISPLFTLNILFFQTTGPESLMYMQNHCYLVKCMDCYKIEVLCCCFLLKNHLSSLQVSSGLNLRFWWKATLCYGVGGLNIVLYKNAFEAYVSNESTQFILCIIVVTNSISPRLSYAFTHIL